VVYSTGLYFASHFERLTNEMLSNFNVKEKLEKTILKKQSK
jgi:hypothetical protein